MKKKYCYVCEAQNGGVLRVFSSYEKAVRYWVHDMGGLLATKLDNTTGVMSAMDDQKFLGFIVRRKVE